MQTGILMEQGTSRSFQCLQSGVTYVHLLGHVTTPEIVIRLINRHRHFKFECLYSSMIISSHSLYLSTFTSSISLSLSHNENIRLQHRIFNIPWCIVQCNEHIGINKVKNKAIRDGIPRPAKHPILNILGCPSWQSISCNLCNFSFYFTLFLKKALSLWMSIG